MRKELIRKAVEDEIKKHAVEAIKAREEDARDEKKQHNKKILHIAEDNYLKDMRDETEKIEEIQKTKRIVKHAKRNAQNQTKRENIVSALQKLRYGMDQLDSQADKMIYTRIVKQSSKD